MKDKKKFKGFMLLIGEIFNKNLSKELLDIYWQILEPFVDEQCEKAFKEIMATVKFFPKPAEILEHLAQGIPHMLAWQMAFNALKEVGPYTSVKFPDNTIHLTIELMGGWPAFCMMETEEIKWKQIEFQKIYQGICQKGDDFAGHLPGIIEEENLKKGICPSTDMVMISESAKRKFLD